MSAQTPQFGDLSIGKAAADEFVRLPQLPALFRKRAARIETLAENSPTAGFLRLMGKVFAAQAAASEAGSPVEAPSAEALARAGEHVMPPLSPESWTPTATYREALRLIAADIPRDALPSPTVEALNGIAAASDGVLPQWQAEVLFAAAALQVEFARIAALIPPQSLAPLDAAGPVPGVRIALRRGRGRRGCRLWMALPDLRVVLDQLASCARRLRFLRRREKYRLS